MQLPESVLAARERMAKADAALHAGIESDAPADKISHKLWMNCILRQMITYRRSPLRSRDVNTNPHSGEYTS